jgi:hypothetical protein
VGHDADITVAVERMAAGHNCFTPVPAKPAAISRSAPNPVRH